MRRRTIYIIITAAAALISIDDVSPTATARRNLDKPTSIQQVHAGDNDKVYREGEVDKEAQLRNEDKFFKSFNSEFKCPDTGGKVAVTLLLHKSGKVTDVKVDVSPNCGVTEKGRAILLRLKFTPAIKGGARVSEVMTIDIRREPIVSPGPS